MKLLVLVSLFGSFTNAQIPEGFFGEIDMDPNNSERMRFTVECQKNTWFSFMLSEGKMGGADMVRFLCEGAGKVTDMIGTSNYGAPIEDGT